MYSSAFKKGTCLQIFNTKIAKMFLKNNPCPERNQMWKLESENAEVKSSITIWLPLDFPVCRHLRHG
jgi:hypothetical protein